MKQATLDTIYLLSCAVNCNAPDSKTASIINLDAVYDISSKHMLSAAVAVALESAGIKNPNFTQVLAKAQRKAVIYDEEIKTILSAFEKTGVWYMPLKGAVLKNLYPQFGMREMSDIDILIDSEKSKDVKEIMESLGFTTETFSINNEDTYIKPPLTNVEIHKSLFGFQHDRELYEYYANIKSRLVKDEENQYGYHFTSEDFYIYMIAHEYMHFQFGGTGLRSLLDTYIYLQNMEMDEKYVNSEIEKLGISEFEKKNKELAIALFAENRIVDFKMFESFFSSGTYGTTERFVENRMNKQGKGKIAYLFGRLYGTNNDEYWNYLKQRHPFIYKHKELLPMLPFIRVGYAMKKKPKKVMEEFKAVMKKKKI